MVPPTSDQLVDHQNLLSDAHLQFQAWVSTAKMVKVTKYGAKTMTVKVACALKVRMKVERCDSSAGIA